MLIDGQTPSAYQVMRERAAARRVVKAQKRLAQVSKDSTWSGEADPLAYVDSLPADVDPLEGPMIDGGWLGQPAEPTRYVMAPRVANVRPDGLSADGYSSLRTRYPDYAAHPRTSIARRLQLRVAMVCAVLNIRTRRIAERNAYTHRTYHGHAYLVDVPTPGLASTSRAVMHRGTRGLFPRELFGESFFPDRDAVPFALPWGPRESEAVARGAMVPLPTREIERATDAFLRAHANHAHYVATIRALADGRPGEVPDRPTLLRLDVIDPYTRQPTVAPDAVAFRGASRYRHPSPCRYGHTPAVTYTLPGDYTASDDQLAADNVLGVPPRATTWMLYRTDMTWKRTLRESDGTARCDVVDKPRRIVVRDVGDAWHWTRGTVPYPVAVPATRPAGFALIGNCGSLGSARIATDDAARKARHGVKRSATVQRARAGSTGTRGKAVDVWHASERSIPRMISRATDEIRGRVNAWHTYLTMLPAEHPVALCAVTVRNAEVPTVIPLTVSRDSDGAMMTLSTGVRMTVRDVARRAALAGVVPD